MIPTRPSLRPGNRPSQTMEDRAVAAIQRTWDAVVDDVLEDQIVRNRNHAVEIVMDSDFLCAYGGDADAVRWLLALDVPQRKRIALRVQF